MTKEAKQETKQQDAAPTNGGPPPSGWKRIEMNRPLYKGERGKGGTIRGVLLGLLPMPPVNGKPWSAFVVRLTAPCASCEDRDNKPVAAEEGTEILVPATHQLRQHLARAAMQPRIMFEVYIKPTGKVKTNAGEMVVYEAYVNPTPIQRDAAAKLLALHSPNERPTVPAPADVDDAASDDIPF